MYSKQYRREKLHGWGGYPIVPTNVFRPERTLDLVEFIKKEGGSFLARGSGTSYGDASVNIDGTNIDMRRLNKILNFNPENGVLHCQSGVVLRDITKIFVTKGWFLHVTPGTQWATVGGCVACDVHGKNYKSGSFSNYVTGISLMLADGNIIQCNDNENLDIYRATFGGMGMTGIILDVHIQLRKIRSSYMDVETIRCSNLKEVFDLQYSSMHSHEYLFSWLDSHSQGKSMGRGILQRANHCITGDLQYKEKARILVPFKMPNLTLNKLAVTVFNHMYFVMTHQYKQSKPHLNDFFYPLDRFANWYRVYGRKGFIEYQVVVPTSGAYETIFQLLEKITKSRLGSTIAAVKPLIKSDGLMSFPIDGFTLAVDFGRNDRLWSLLDSLDAIVHASGGRVYLAKDARLSGENFTKMYSHALEKWACVRNKYNVNYHFRSMMFNRLFKS